MESLAVQPNPVSVHDPATTTAAAMVMMMPLLPPVVLIADAPAPAREPELVGAPVLAPSAVQH